MQLMDPFKVPPIPNTTEFKETLEDRRSTESQSWKLLQNSEKCFLTRKLVFGCGPVLLHRKIQPPNKCNQKDKKEECCNMGLYWKQQTHLVPPAAIRPLLHCVCWSSELPKNCVSHIDASHSRQPLVKGERLVRYEVNAVMTSHETFRFYGETSICTACTSIHIHTQTQRKTHTYTHKEKTHTHTQKKKHTLTHTHKHTEAEGWNSKSPIFVRKEHEQAKNSCNSGLRINKQHQPGCRTLLPSECPMLLGRSPSKNCKNDLDDQT